MSNGNYIENASIVRPRQLLIIFLTVRLYFDLQMKITVCYVRNWIDNFKMMFNLTCCLVKANKTPEDESHENNWKQNVNSQFTATIATSSIKWHNLCSKKLSPFILLFSLKWIISVSNRNGTTTEITLACLSKTLICVRSHFPIRCKYHSFMVLFTQCNTIKSKHLNAAVGVIVHFWFIASLSLHFILIASFFCYDFLMYICFAKQWFSTCITSNLSTFWNLCLFFILVTPKKAHGERWNTLEYGKDSNTLERMTAANVLVFKGAFMLREFPLTS